MTYFVRQFHSSDIVAIQSIADNALGKDYFRILAGETVFVSEDRSGVTGFVCGSIEDNKEAILRTICVRGDQRGKGIGQRLGREFIDNIPVGVDVYSPAWIQSNEVIPAGSLLQALGFVPQKTIQNYWKKDSLAFGYTCPECGAPPCRCSAKIFKFRPLFKENTPNQ